MSHFWDKQKQLNREVQCTTKKSCCVATWQTEHIRNISLYKLLHIVWQFCHLSTRNIHTWYLKLLNSLICSFLLHHYHPRFSGPTCKCDFNIIRYNRGGFSSSFWKWAFESVCQVTEQWSRRLFHACSLVSVCLPYEEWINNALLEWPTHLYKPSAVCDEQNYPKWLLVKNILVII